MDPARIRESNADLLVIDAPLFDLPMPAEIEELAGRKGLVDGVGRLDDFAEPEAATAEACPPMGGNAEDGAVPALLLRKLDVLCGPSESGLVSGKESSLGDSGMVSFKGVDRPELRGGPHNDRVEPSAWSSRAL